MSIYNKTLIPKFDSILYMHVFALSTLGLPAKCLKYIKRGSYNLQGTLGDIYFIMLVIKYLHIYIFSVMQINTY